ncbi:MAG: DUF4105 domain-containing protein [Deltaproteobacteria bacterium]|nr:DUF4105 domain-containing protein [Deltaproteobacteria bacterium]
MKTDALKKPSTPFFKGAWLLFVFIILFPALSFSEESHYADKLISEAVARKLHEKRGWQVLIHYRPTLLHGKESIIDDPDFFLSKEGKTNPQKEMEETIRAFFSTEKKDDSHARCRFAARYDWLKKELDMDEREVPSEDCKGFKELMEAVRPESATLVFPVAHMNSPASMFGHTLLRIDSSYQSKLFSYAINYSAITDETNGLFFAFKGIFGFYEGYFGILPYYEKIKEYSNMENRDIWEYRLDFSREEVERMIMHIWELKDVYAYYFFFDENCSYNLLLVLEAARPDVALTETLPKWVIPMDTVRAVQSKGIYSNERVFRPSKATRIKQIESVTSADNRKIARDISLMKAGVDDFYEDAGVGEDDKVKTLDLAAEYTQYLYLKGKIPREEYLKLYLKVLSARSKLGIKDAYNIAAPIPPEQGHGPIRLALGAGTKSGALYNSFKIRPANHDLMDPDVGYPPGAAITFLETEMRYNYTERKLSIERVSLVDITSVSEFDGFFKPISWKVNAGAQREEVRKKEHRTVLMLNGGPGMSVREGDALIYGFVEPEAKFGSGLGAGYALGIGVSGGVLKPITPGWKAQAQVKAVSFGIGESHSVISAEVNQLFLLNASNGVRLDLKRERFDGFYSNDFSLSWNRYF